MPERALEAARRNHDRLGEANVRQAIGDVQQFRKDMDAALASYAAALTAEVEPRSAALIRRVLEILA